MDHTPGAADEVVFLVQQASATVLHELGHGHKESPYARALALALREQRIVSVDAEVPLTILYKETPVGVCFADLVLTVQSTFSEDGTCRAVIEVKVTTSTAANAASSPSAAHVAQAKKYQELLGADYAMVVTFTLTGVRVDFC